MEQAIEVCRQTQADNAVNNIMKIYFHRTDGNYIDGNRDVPRKAAEIKLDYQLQFIVESGCTQN